MALFYFRDYFSVIYLTLQGFLRHRVDSNAWRILQLQATRMTKTSWNDASEDSFGTLEKEPDWEWAAKPSELKTNLIASTIQKDKAQAYNSLSSQLAFKPGQE